MQEAYVDYLLYFHKRPQKRSLCIPSKNFVYNRYLFLKQRLPSIDFQQAPSELKAIVGRLFKKLFFSLNAKRETRRSVSLFLEFCSDIPYCVVSATNCAIIVETCARVLAS